MAHIYYFTMEGSPWLLADERHKKHFLDGILAVHEEQNWPVYAFCVMDQTAYLISEAENRKQLRALMTGFARAFLKQYAGALYPGAGKRLHLGLGQVERLTAGTGLVEACRRIHLIPIREGYARWPEDYWWSSYRMYLGGYCWHGVECGTIQKYFSSDRGLAIRMLKRFHRSPDGTDPSAAAAEVLAAGKRRGRPAGSVKRGKIAACDGAEGGSIRHRGIPAGSTKREKIIVCDVAEGDGVQRCDCLTESAGRSKSAEPADDCLAENADSGQEWVVPAGAGERGYAAVKSDKPPQGKRCPGCPRKQTGLLLPAIWRPQLSTADDRLLHLEPS